MISLELECRYVEIRDLPDGGKRVTLTNIDPVYIEKHQLEICGVIAEIEEIFKN